MITVKVLWGTEETREDQGNPKPSEYTFGTQAEADAFLLGVEESNGWMEYEVVS